MKRYTWMDGLVTVWAYAGRVACTQGQKKALMGYSPGSLLYGGDLPE